MSKVLQMPGSAPGQAETRTTAQVIEACRQEMDESKLSIAAAAREMGRGVSTATLSKWLRGIYEGDVETVTGRVEAWLATRRDGRSRSIAAAGVDRHVEIGVTEEVETVLAHAQAVGDIVLVHGRSGAGKSWAAERYCRSRTAAHRVMATPSLQSLSGLLARIAGAVGAGQPVGALASENAIVERLQGRRALLVVDEAHHLAPRLLDELRCLRDLSGAGLALIGGDELWTKLAGSTRCDQIVGRIGVRLPLGAAPDADVRELVASVLGREPTKRELKGCVAAARGAGGLHSLRRLCARAWVIARGANREHITEADLAVAAEAGAPC